jgi:hypothetical protein
LFVVLAILTIRQQSIDNHMVKRPGREHTSLPIHSQGAENGSQTVANPVDEGKAHRAEGTAEIARNLRDLSEAMKG